MGDRDHKAALSELEKKIAAAKAANAPAKKHQEEHYSQAQTGWRMVSELVAGLLIGFGMGYGLDYLLGTLPIFLVLMTLLGFAGGVKTMIITAREFNVEDANATKGDMPVDKADEDERT
ncbi:AtpZ/AtpI family protein [Rhodalgimonas zhirmunskyi]|uniref:ATP synthase protein I n=1 Tax=Rhodalgimonas zhirmunskyi TaxID=2964767 RepID=A0AAJ1UC59_9RHOB|nr:AtpZ/AtpI family protein [Rhodoalgimonas zhirmunskyi]MDQ2095820.1 AtpZ/AtpI family protein [Rhodoalgimonas zhirmunskyi]